LSGGYPIQIAYDHAGSLQTRIGSSATAWNAWKAIHVAGNNLTAGTISSGAITSTGNITTTGSAITVDPASGDAILSLQGASGGQTLRIDQNSIRSSTNSPISFLTNSQLSFRLNTDRSVEVTNGDFKIGGTTVISASRNITMGSSLTVAADGGSNYTSNHIRFMSHNTARGAGHFLMDDAGANTWYTGTAYSDAFNNWGVHYKAANEDEETAHTQRRVFSVSKVGNAVFSGTINSGAITSSGDIKTSGTALGVTQTDGDYLAKLYQAGADGILELFTGQATPLSRIKLHSYSTSYINPASGGLGLGVTTVGSGQKLNVGGGIGISGTTVIDASRNLINLANITQTSGFSIYLGTKTRLSSDNNGEVGLNYGTTSGTASTSLAIYNNTTKTISLNRNGTITSGAITTIGSFLVGTRGKMGQANNDLFICSTTSQHSGLQFANGAIHPTNNTGAPSDSAQIDLGSSSYRFSDIYARNATILTSDRNEKQDIEVLSAAEQRVAVAAKGLLRKFRWKDAVSEKGDGARIHFGIIAQDLQAAFVAEGLDAGRYGMFTSNTWDEDGVDKTRMGVRYSELLAFIISAI